MVPKFLVLCALLHGLNANVSPLVVLGPESKNASSLGKQWQQSKFQELSDSLSENGDAVSITRGAGSFGNSTGESAESETSWFEDIPLLQNVFATSATLPDGTCKDQVRRYLRDLRRGKLWAVQMLDASTKYPNGIIYGNTRDLGNFDQCYDLQASLPSEEGFDAEEVSGRHCLVDLEYHPMHAGSTSGPLSLSFDPNESAWEAVREKGDFRRLKRYNLLMAICVPATCSAADVEVVLKEPLQQLAAKKGVHLKTTVERKFCQARIDEPEFSTAATIYCVGYYSWSKYFYYSYIILGLVVLVVFSTWYDSSLCKVYGEEHSSSKGLLVCFSARRNLQSICSLKSFHPGLDTIHLIRFFSTVLVILGHRNMQFYSYALIESVGMEESFTKPVSTLLYNGAILVDGFLGIGGLLTAYSLCMELEITKRVHFIAHILNRFLRLTPPYMMVVFFHMYVLPHLGKGPYWEARIGLERDYCTANWWTNLLYINNYVNSEKLCMFQSWYLAVDFHMHIISLFVMYAFWKMPRRLGYIFLGSLIAVSCMIPFIITYVNELDPIMFVFPSQKDIREIPYFITYYIKTHMRAAPYMVGVLAGVIVYDHKGATWKLPKAWSRILFLLLVVVLSLGSQGIAHKYFDPNYERSLLDSALYAGLHRPAFAMSFCAIVVLITIGDGLDFHRNFMTPWWAPPLARLTYGSFLVHNLNQIYEIGIMRVPRLFLIRTMMGDLIPDVVYTFILSLAVSIAVEGPLRKMEKMLLRKMVRRSAHATSSQANGVKKMD